MTKKRKKRLLNGVYNDLMDRLVENTLGKFKDKGVTDDT